MSLSRSLPAGDVMRARMILMLADGRSYTEIQKRLQTTAPTISRWKTRFLEAGISGLVDVRHPGQKPSVITAKLQARVLDATRRKPKDGSTHWSVRKLARELQVSKDTIHRIWRTAGVKPHRLERYMASDDPDFEAKAADIIGLYLDPPQHAAVFCVDEKSAMQALDRLDPVLPLSPGRVERHGFEYYRHGEGVLVEIFLNRILHREYPFTKSIGVKPIKTSLFHNFHCAAILDCCALCVQNCAFCRSFGTTLPS
jgi:transposase